MQEKKNKVRKEIERETFDVEKEITKFKSESLDKINVISEEVTANLIKDIFGEDLNRSSIQATVAEVTKDYRNKKK